VTWAQIDDGFADHPKHADLSNDATATWVRLLAYCSRYLTDGAVPRSVATRSSRVNTRQRADEVLAELCAAGLLDDRGEFLYLHDYLDWNRSRAVVLGEREATKARKSAWYAKKNAVRNASRTEEERRSERVLDGVGNGSRTLPSPLLSTRSRDPEIPPCIPPSEPAAPEAPKAKPAKPRAEPTGDHARLIRHYDEAHAAARGTRPTDWPRVAKAAQTLLAKVGDVAEAMRRIDVMLADPYSPRNTIDDVARSPDRFAAARVDPKPKSGVALVQRQQGLHEAPRDLVTGLPWGDP
jgi:hypothetical protein